MSKKDSFMRPVQNVAIKSFFHLVGIAALAWCIGAIISFFTNEASYIGFNLAPIYTLKRWYIWLYNSWSLLSWNAYNYLKIKLILSALIPITVTALVYIRFVSAILEWEPIPAPESVFGDARWATQADVKRAGLRSKEGMLLGVDKGGYFIADGFQHALLFAPTGSGKGVGFVIPNLLFWHHSMVVHDIKLENYELTSGWRAKQGQECYVWEPANPEGRTHCYNPIDWVSSKPGQMVDDVQKIANLIIEEKDFWNNEARSLFLGVTLYLLADITKAKSFGEVVRTLRSDDVVYNLAVVMDTLGGVMHPVAYMNLAAFLQKADKERSGVISTLNSALELWANPLLDVATASSDFNIQEFKKKKVTVYVGLTPDNINRLQKLMRIFYQQATEFLSRKMPNIKEEPYGVMFLMDEFPTLGKMEQIKAGIAYFRGYRVRLFLIIQDTQQLKGTYEDAGMNSFLSNSTFRITFAANNYETANLISQLCGNKTVEQVSSSRPKFFDLNPATRTQNVSHAQRALLLPQEVIQLPRDEQILLIESMPPIRSKKIFYYKDKMFTERLLPPVFIPIQEAYDPKKQEEAEEEAKAEESTSDNTSSLASQPTEDIIEDTSYNEDAGSTSSDYNSASDNEGLDAPVEESFQEEAPIPSDMHSSENADISDTYSNEEEQAEENSNGEDGSNVDSEGGANNGYDDESSDEPDEELDNEHFNESDANSQEEVETHEELHIDTENYDENNQIASGSEDMNSEQVSGLEENQHLDDEILHEDLEDKESSEELSESSHDSELTKPSSDKEDFNQVADNNTHLEEGEEVNSSDEPKPSFASDSSGTTDSLPSVPYGFGDEQEEDIAPKDSKDQKKSE